MSDLSIDETVTYHYTFEFENVKLGFKKKLLFDLSGVTPKLINQSENNNSFGWWVNRKWLSKTKAESLVKNEPITIDLSGLQWYQQIQLQECFNLK
jgi:hypothetical protein